MAPTSLAYAPPPPENTLCSLQEKMSAEQRAVSHKIPKCSILLSDVEQHSLSYIGS